MKTKVIHYLRAGDCAIRGDDILGIFDLDNSTTSKHTVKFLNLLEKKGCVINLASDIPSGLIVTERNGRCMAYLSQFSSRTLRDRFI